jgi:hypothetical protein
MNTFMHTRTRTILSMKAASAALKTHTRTAIPMIIEGQFQVFQRFSSSKPVLKTVESCFVALNYDGNGSTKSCA